MMTIRSPAAARMVVIGVLHVVRVLAFIGFLGAAWWLAMLHHDDFDFFMGMKVIAPFWVAVAVSRLLLDVVRRKWTPPCAS
jgi:hypothetical protein